ncbi:hypothetical protein E4T56_gene14608 [Termitomyces sp. T112]|nr:hypothetical protein E4T56_gene14608 [Termitomyces sp. T112]
MASLVFFIKKKDGPLQLVQDYQVLNAMMVKNRYPLPLISELINNLWCARYFTKLDIWWGYNNMHIQEGDEWKAAFRTNRGLFELLVMFFGLTNSPTTFQTMMNNIFQDLIVEGIHQLYLKPEKCKFEQIQIEYLGLTISHRAVEMDPVKVAGMAEWLEPQNKKEVQAFLGFANFYQRFIQDFLHHVCPLFDLRGKDVMWSWGPLEQSAFDTLKHAMTSGHVLLFPDDNSPFCMEANSSNAKFQYNNHVHSSTQFSSFFLDTRWHPCMGFEPRAQPLENEAVNEFVDQMKESQEEAQATLAKAKDDMAWYYDCGRTPEHRYQPGDQVYLDASNITTTHPSKKLLHCQLEPFTVEQQIGSLAY